MVKRGKIILIKGVLTLLKTKKQVSITEIISIVKLSSVSAYEIVGLLAQTGLICKDRINQNRPIYKINQNGKKALRTIIKLETILTPLGMAYLAIICQKIRPLI